MKAKFRLPANLKQEALEDNFTTSEIRGITLFYDYILSRDVNKRDPAIFAYDYVQVGRDLKRSFLGKGSYNRIIGQLLHLACLERLSCDENGSTGKDDKYIKEGFYRMPKDVVEAHGEEADTLDEYQPRCKSYRVPSALKSGERNYRIVKLDLTKVEQNKVEAAKLDRIEFTEKYRDIVRKNMENLALVDTAECRAYIVANYSYEGVQVNPEDFIDNYSNTLFTDTSVDAFGHRVHGPLTNAAKGLRKFTRFKSDMDTPLVEVDFVASQPSLLACVTPTLIKKFAPECGAAMPLFKAIQENPDWIAYKALCLNDTPGEGIYDVLAATYTQEYGVAMTRDNGKEIYYRACFSDYVKFSKRSLKQLEASHLFMLKNGSQKQRERSATKIFTKRCILLFEKHFKTVYDLFWSLKTMVFDIEGATAPHANNCLLAQRIESALMYTVLVKAVREAGITDVVTIHDGLFIKATDEDKVRKIVEKQLNKLQLNLKLKTK